MARNILESLENRTLFNALTPDVTWGNDGSLPTPAGSSVRFVGLSGGGLVGVTRETNGDQYLRRYDQNGSLDANFGPIAMGRDLRQQTDVDTSGRTLVGGLTTVQNKIYVRRVLANGTIDQNYGSQSAAVVNVTLPPSGESLNSISFDHVLADSTGAAYVIYTVAGSSQSVDQITDRTYVARLLPGGGVDESFGSGGTLQLSASLVAVRYAFVDAADRLVVGGGRRSDAKFLVLRYATSGSLDATFGTGGVLVTTSGQSFVNRMAVDNQSRVLLAVDDNSPTLHRYTAGGAVDSSFGSGGVVTLAAGEFSNVRSILPQSDGKIFVETSYAFVRLNANGTRDTTFDTDGLADYDYQGYGTQLGGYGNVVAQASDGNYFSNELSGSLDDGIQIRKLALRDNVALGTSGTMYITGTDGNDTISTVLRTAGYDVIFNGQTTSYTSPLTKFDIGLRGGNDSFDIGVISVPVIATGGLGNDTIITGDANDSINGNEGDDTISTRGGSDQIDGDSGANTINAGSGNAVIRVNSGLANTITGTSGAFDLTLGGEGRSNVTLTGTTANINAFTNKQGDVFDLSGMTGFVSVLGGSGDDSILTGAGDDIVFAAAGNDTVRSGAGRDAVYGDYDTAEGPNGDLYDLGTGNDLVKDGYGNNTVLGGDGNDRIFTGFGNDSVIAGVGRDQVRTADGTDYIEGNGSRDTLYGGNGNDTILGGQNGDTIIGGLGDDSLSGNQGDDLIIAGNPNAARIAAARNLIDGGSENDRLQLESDDDTRTGVESIIDVVA